ncbi:MAG: hypothetical protein H0U35_11190 [Sporichthyaceae bacterium]|nr:hypothetical protein [Sporichthyaceae bacterium]
MDPVRDWLSRYLQREQRVREPLRPEQRAALLPYLADDVRRLADLLNEPFDDWHRHSRTAIVAEPDRKFGTGYTSIDDPFGERARQGGGRRPV